MLSLSSYFLYQFLYLGEFLCNVDQTPTIWLLAWFQDPNTTGVLIIIQFEIGKFWAVNPLLHMKGKRQIFERINILWTIKALHVVEKGFFVWQMEVIFESVVDSGFVFDVLLVDQRSGREIVVTYSFDQLLSMNNLIDRWLFLFRRGERKIPCNFSLLFQNFDLLLATIQMHLHQTHGGNTA